MQDSGCRVEEKTSLRIYGLPLTYFSFVVRCSRCFDMVGNVFGSGGSRFISLYIAGIVGGHVFIKMESGIKASNVFD